MRSAAIILLVIGVGFSILNWACLIASRRRKRFVSPYFPAPSVLTALGLAMLEETRPYWWLGLLTDYTLFALLIASPSWVAGAWRTSRFTRMQLLRAGDAPRRFELSLQRGGGFQLRATFEPPVPIDGHGVLVSSFGAVGRWEPMPDGRLRLSGYREDRVAILEPSGDGFISREERGAGKGGQPHESLDGLRFEPVA